MMFMCLCELELFDLVAQFHSGHVFGDSVSQTKKNYWIFVANKAFGSKFRHLSAEKGI